MFVVENKTSINQLKNKKMDLVKSTAGAEEAVVIKKAPAVSHEEVGITYRTVAIGSKGQVRESVRVDMGGGNSDVNSIIQFDITNNGGGAVDETVRIGSFLGLPDAYAQFNTTKSAADSIHGIVDNFGANCLKCQGFSLIVSATPVYIRTIKLISSDTVQLNQQFQHKMILPDFTIIPLVQNIAFTREKTDSQGAVDLNVAKGSWSLGSRNFLEFISKSTKSISILLEIASISDVRQFVQLK